MDFVTFRNAVAKNFSEMQAHQLYRTKAPKDGLWTTYLAAFPEGSNPIYRERTEHDCQCCKQFIRAVGNVVAIIDGRIVTIWDSFFVNDDAYNVVAACMENYVKSFEIDNVFTHDEQTAGKSRNFQDLLDGKVKAWDHFFVNIPSQYFKQNPGAYLGDIHTTYDLLNRSLDTISKEAVKVVIELIEQNSLYRGSENLFAVKEFSKIQDLIADKGKSEITMWPEVFKQPQSVSRIRNTSIGTLLVDLSEGVFLDAAVASFEAKVAPQNYKRPTALVTKSMIDNAKKKIEELGLVPSLERRYANINDITINNILFADKTARQTIQGCVFDSLVTKSDKPKNLDKVEDVTIEQFINHILPGAESIEVMMEHNHQNNLVSLIAPDDPTARPMFKWDNRFSWSYNGDMADSIKERVKQAGGNVTGELCCRLAWDYADDLDFYMREPTGHIIYFSNRREKSQCGGMLDVDANGIDGVRANPVENIFYNKIANMRDGTYELYVKNYTRRSNGVGFEAEIDLKGSVTNLSYDKVVSQDGKIMVAYLRKSNNEVKIDTLLPSTKSSREIWGVSTNKFQKVNVVMLSPNFWDDKSVGNKHYFFMLDGCRNDGKARGFFNEFLTSELDEHRKVIELVGSKLKTEESEKQLSGLGFSSTQRSNLLCRVNGSFTRVVNIVF